MNIRAEYPLHQWRCGNSNKHVERWPTSSVMRVIRIKATLRYHFTLTGAANQKNWQYQRLMTMCNNQNRLLGDMKNGANPLENSFWQFLEKLIYTYYMTQPPKRNKNMYPYKHLFLKKLFIVTLFTKYETPQMSINWWTHEHIYTIVHRGPSASSGDWFRTLCRYQNGRMLKSLI